MNDQIQHFLIKLAALILIGPLVGLCMLNFVTLAEDAWKTNNRKKKWIVMCGIFGMIAGYSGWFL